MAKNTNKRIPVKYVRDKAKSAYTKQTNCYICGVSEDLELHHLHSITRLLNTWAVENQVDISTDEAIIACREEFINQHHTEIYELVYTLCNKHHVKLHSVYGKSPTEQSVPKQKHWIEAQKAKLSGIDASHLKPKVSLFSKFT